MEQDSGNPPPIRQLTPEALHLKNLLAAFKKRYEAIEQNESTHTDFESKEELEALKMQQKRLLEINFELQTKLDAYKSTSSQDDSDGLAEELRLSHYRAEKLAELLREKEQKILECHHFEVIAKKAQEMKSLFERQIDESESKKSKLESEVATFRAASQEQKQHTEQLERAIQFLRGRLEDSNLEINQFKEDFQKSQEIIKSLHEEKKAFLNKCDLIDLELSKSKLEKLELNEELAHIQGQFEQLRAMVIKLQSAKEALEEELANEKEQASSTKSEASTLNLKLSEKEKAFQTLQEEVNSIRQALIRGLKEIKELEEHNQVAVNEKNNAFNRIHQLQRQLEKEIEKEEALRVQFYDLEQKMNAKEAEFLEEKNLKEEEHWKLIDSLQKTLEEQKLENEQKALEVAKKSEEWHQAISLQRHQFEAHLQKMQEHQREEIRRFQERLAAQTTLETEKNDLLNQIDHLNANVTHLQKSLQDLTQESIAAEERQNRHFQEKAEEKDNEIRVAHQHLAKKVKEATLLAEKNDVLSQELSETKKAVDLHLAKTQHLEQAIKLEGEHQKRIQDQLVESVKLTEEKLARMEEKFSETKEKLKKEQMRVLELEKLAERHQQIQNALSNLGFLPKETTAPIKPAPLATRQESDPEIVAEQNQELKEPEESPKIPPKPFNNLFELPKSNPKPKLNLFD